MYQIFSLYKGHFKNSKKIFIYSSIGLIIALTLISSSLYFIDNTQAELINKNFNKNSYAGNDIIINVQSDFSVGKTTENQNALSNSITKVIKNYNLDFINKSSLRVTDGYSGFAINMPIINFQNQKTVSQYATEVIQLTPYLKKELENNHQLFSKNDSINFPQSNPTSNSSSLQAYILYIKDPYMTSQQIDQNAVVKKGNLTIYPNFNTRLLYNLNITDYSFYQRTVSNIYYYDPYGSNQLQLNPGSASSYPYLSSILNYNGGNYFNTILFVSNLTQFGNMINSQTSTPTVLQNNIKNQYIVHLGFDYSHVDISHINSILGKQTYFEQTLIGTLSVQNFKSINVIFQTTNALRSIQYEIQAMSYQNWMNDFPILIVSLFLISFSFSLIYKNIVRNIGIYKTRGASRWLMFWFQIFDLAFIILVSVFSAMLLGIPISVISLKSNYLLSFNTASPPYFVFNYESIMNILFLWGVFFMLVIDLNRIRKLSKVSITEAENDTEKGDPYWKRHYIDIILLIYGILFLSFIYLINNNPTFSRNLQGIYSIITLLLLPSPFALIVGLILFISRFISIILNKLSSVLWKRSGGLVAYSFKNIIRYRHTTIRAILLTTTVMAFVMLAFVQPYSSVVNYSQTVNYQSGADGNLVFNNNKIDLSTVRSIQSHFPQYIDSLSSYVTATTNTNLNDHLNFLLVNISTYVQSSNLNFDLGLKHNIHQDFKDLNASAPVDPTTPVNILLDQISVKQRDAKIGSNITLSYSVALQRFRIIDSFVHWPFIRAGSNNFGFSGGLYAIADINYYLNDLNGSISNSVFTSINSAGLFIKFKPNINVTQAVLDIENFAPVRFTYAPQVNVHNYVNGFSFLTTTGQVNLIVLVSFLILMTIMLFFVQFQINERKREIYTERALGMKRDQLAFVFFIENMIITGISLLVGFVTGIFLVYVINMISQNPYQTYPKSVSIVPFNVVFLADGLVLLLSVIFSIIPTMYVVKQNISDSFASEY